MFSSLSSKVISTTLRFKMVTIGKPQTLNALLEIQFSPDHIKVIIITIRTTHLETHIMRNCVSPLRQYPILPRLEPLRKMQGDRYLHFSVINNALILTQDIIFTIYQRPQYLTTVRFLRGNHHRRDPTQICTDMVKWILTMLPMLGQLTAKSELRIVRQG